jgi:hypothetical protein
MPHLGFDLPLPASGVALRRGHWSTVGLRALLVPDGSRSVRLYDPVRDLFTPIGDLSHGPQVPTATGLIGFTTISDVVQIAPDSSQLISTTQVTLLLVRRKMDGTARAACHIGVDDDPATLVTRCNAYVPYNDGTVKWTFGGSTDGTTKVTISGLTFTPELPEAWAFVAGPNGMAVYLNGVLLGSHATPAARTAATEQFTLNQGGTIGVTGDITEVSFAAVLDAEWNEEQVKEWSANQACMFAPRPLATRYYTVPRPDGVDIWIDGESIIDKIDQSALVTIRLDRGELSEMRFRTLCNQNYVPEQFLDAYAFDENGAEIFGGLVRYRNVDAVGSSSRFADVTCLGWWFYFTVSLVTIHEEDSITLKEVLQELLSQLPADYGITLDPLQPDGPTFDSFNSGENVKASEVIRRLQTDTANLGGYVPDLTPNKVLSMYPAGTVAAPLSLTTATPNCRTAKWKDSNDNPVNHIVLTCGSADEGGPVTHTWIADGVTFVFSLDGENIPASAVSPGYVEVNGNFELLYTPEEAVTNGIEYDQYLDSGTLTFKGTAQSLVTVGIEVTLYYQPQRPFTVEVSTGASPIISEVRTNTNIHTYADAIVAAEGLLAELGQSNRELEVFSLQGGWRPSQSLTVQLSQLDLDSSFTIGPVTIAMLTPDWWEYRFTAQETSIVQPGYLSRLRTLIASMAGQG